MTLESSAAGGRSGSREHLAMAVLQPLVLVFLGSQVNGGDASPPGTGSGVCEHEGS